MELHPHDISMLGLWTLAAGGYRTSLTVRKQVPRKEIGKESKKSLKNRLPDRIDMDSERWRIQRLTEKVLCCIMLQ